MPTVNLGRVGFVNKGVYSAITAYKVQDVVTYNGGVYAALQASTGNLPTDPAFWAPWVSAVESVVHAAGGKTTPVDADEFLLIDSASSFSLKKTTWASIKAMCISLFAAKGANNDITSLGAMTEPFSFRNKIINGNFGINQRAVSGTVTLAAGAYGHDRFKAGASGCTYTFATLNNVTTLTITAGSLMQVIEGVNLQSGTHILSWTGTAQGRIDTGAYGASGVIGTAVGGTNQACEWGVGTLSLVQYEKGSVATPFENRLNSMEKHLCYAYFNSIGYADAGSGVRSAGYAKVSSYAASVIYYPQMRAIPTVTISAPGDFIVSYQNSVTTVIGYVVAASSSNSCGIDWNCAAVLNPGDGIAIDRGNSNARIYLDAEL